MRKDLSSKLGKRLMAYSAAAGAILAVGQTANAQVITYTDVDPDATVSSGTYELDLNNDGTAEFILEQGSFFSGWSTIRIKPGYYAGFMSTQYPPASGWGTYTFAQQLSSGSSVAPTATFNSSFLNSTMSLGFFGTITGGPWPGQTEQFLGLRFSLDNGSTFHYGWARISVDASCAQFTIHDYAYNETADEAIDAGETGSGGSAAATASDLAASDVGDNGNGADFQVAFTKAGDESTVSMYRVIAVKAANAGDFDLTAAEAVTSDNYTEVTPDGSDPSVILGETATDADGDLIAEGTTYVAFVLSMADGTNATTNALSAGSNELTLQAGVGIGNVPETAFEVYSFDKTLRINITDEQYQDAQFSVYNSMGQEIYVGDAQSTTNDIQLNVNSGVYFVYIMVNNDIITKRVFID